MRRRVHQGPVVMLSMDFDDFPTDRAEDLHADRLIVDKSARAPVRHLKTAEDEITVDLQLLRLGKGARRMREWQIERRGHLPLGLSVTDKPPVTPPSKGERKGIEQDGFTGAGLTRQHAQT